MNNDKYNLYDKIVSASITNLLNYAKESDGKIIFSPYEDEEIYHKYMFNIALITCSISPSQEIDIYLDISIFKYILLKLKYWKNRKFLHRYTPKIDGTLISIDFITTYMVSAFNQPLSILEDIYNEYYKK